MNPLILHVSLFVTAATGDLAPKSGTNLTFNSNTGVLTADGFAGDLTGDVTGDLTGDVTGDVTGNLIIGGHTVDDIDITSEASDADDHLMTALAIKNRIEDYGYSTTTGDITQVTITTASDSGLTGGAVGSSGDIGFTLAVGTIDGGEYS